MTWVAQFALTRPDEPEPTRFTLEEGALLIGRTEPAELCIPVMQMSREHLWLRVHTDGGVTIQDAGSTSGIFVDEQQIANRIVCITSANVVKFGGVTLRLIEASDDRTA